MSRRKLTDAQVAAIRARYADRRNVPCTQRALAAEYGVSSMAIQHALRARGETGVALAAAFGVSRATIARILSGKLARKAGGLTRPARVYPPRPRRAS